MKDWHRFVRQANDGNFPATLSPAMIFLSRGAGDKHCKHEDDEWVTCKSCSWRRGRRTCPRCCSGPSTCSCCPSRDPRPRTPVSGGRWECRCGRAVPTRGPRKSRTPALRRSRSTSYRRCERSASLRRARCSTHPLATLITCVDFTYLACCIHCSRSTDYDTGIVGKIPRAYDSNGLTKDDCKITLNIR